MYAHTASSGKLNPTRLDSTLSLFSICVSMYVRPYSSSVLVLVLVLVLVS